MTILSKKKISFWMLSKFYKTNKSQNSKTQKLGQTNKSILQKEWSYVVWDESADIWCCFSSFYSVQVRAEILGYPELSSSLWSFTRSCNIKNYQGLDFGVLFWLRFSLMTKPDAKKRLDRKLDLANRSVTVLQMMSLHLKIGKLGALVTFYWLQELKFCKLLTLYLACFVSVFLMREILSNNNENNKIAA